MSDMKPGSDAPMKRPLWKVVVETVIILLLAVLFAVLFQSFFVRAFAVTSSSMSPTIKDGDRVFVDNVTYYFRRPRRGDIILFRYPPDSPAALNTTNPFYWPFEQIGETLRLTHRMPSPPFVKRVIATGGETIELRKGQVFIDGKRIEEKYDVPDSYDMPPRKILKGQLFVMSDNRPNSNDSHFWGLVPERSVIGKVFLVWWPLSRFGGRGN